MLKSLKYLFFKYQKSMWYSSQTGTEAGKPLRYLPEFGMVILLLSDSGYKISLINKIEVYLALMIISVIFGRIFVKIGVVKYNTNLSNRENELILSMNESIKNIEQKVNENVKRTRSKMRTTNR
jgi:hypothetical protein